MWKLEGLEGQIRTVSEGPSVKLRKSTFERHQHFADLADLVVFDSVGRSRVVDV